MMSRSARARIIPPVQKIPDDDPIARVLRDHYETEGADAGLRSLDLAGSGGGRSCASPDAAMISRVHRQGEHRRVREALARLSKEHQDTLALAYGVVMREAEHAARKDKTIRRDAENWRSRLRARLPDLGSCAAVVLSSPIVAASFAMSPRQEGAAEWLASKAPRPLVEQIQAESVARLRSARARFSLVYDPRSGPRLNATPPRRTRSFDRDEIARRIDEASA